jgi:glycosyltransferase involved in cell wall biosynthesis
LQPGVDATLWTPALEPSDRNWLRRKLGVPADVRIIVYPGNVHAANAKEVLELYRAMHMLNGEGTKVHLVRTGLNTCPDLVHDFERLASKHVTHLGWIDRSHLVEIIKLADVFVQPGAADDFNRYRLPSKLPEFFAVGRPVILPATNVGLRLRDGVDAMLLHRGDASEIAELVTEVLRRNELAERLGRNARQFAVENFNWQRSALDLDQFYHSVLAVRLSSSDERADRGAR